MSETTKTNFGARRNSVIALSLLTLVLLLVRTKYLVNTPLYEDEGIFLLDARDFYHLYSHSLYMKPPLGAFFYWLANLFQQPFLMLHGMTTVALGLTTFWIYRLIERTTQQAPLALLGGLAFIYLTDSLPDGYGHTSLEHFQNVFLLPAFYWLFFGQQFIRGSVYFWLASLVLHNTLLGLPAIFDYKKENLKRITLSAGILMAAFFGVGLIFPDFMFNCFTFPGQYYNSYEWYVFKWKIYAVRDFLQDPVVLGCAILSVTGLYRLFQAQRQAAVFIVLIGLSVVLTKPMYPQHMMTLYPFMLFLSALALDWTLPRRMKWRTGLAALIGASVGMQMIGAHQETARYIANDGMLKKYTFNENLGYRKLKPSQYEALMSFLKAHAGSTAYAYPSLVPFVYPLTQTQTISTYASNDNMHIVLQHPHLAQKLINTLERETPEYLIKLQDSELDRLMTPLLSQKGYVCASGEITVCRLAKTRQ